MATALKEKEPEVIPAPVKVKALSPSRFGSPGTFRNQWLVTLPRGTVWESMFAADFWTMVARSLALGDTIEVRDDDLTRWGLLLVIESNPGLSHARVAELFSTNVSGANADNADMPGAHALRFDGLADGWGIYRREGNFKLKGGFKTWEQAREVLLTEYEPRVVNRTAIVGH